VKPYLIIRTDESFNLSEEIPIDILNVEFIFNIKTLRKVYERDMKSTDYLTKYHSVINDAILYFIVEDIQLLVQ
jgi:hypothetical protein